MTARDAMRFINDQDETTLQNFVKRLEFRGKDPTFLSMRDAYFNKLPLASAASVLDLGCGTGVVGRALAKREDFPGRVVGVDLSPTFVREGQGLAKEEHVDQRIEFQVGDVHALEYGDAGFDIVIAHTLLSHVTEPLSVLKEAARVTKPGGAVAIFDGDYASWTFGYPDPLVAKAMDEALIATIVNNPRVMRDLPRLLRQAGLEISETMAYNYAEIGSGSFFPGAAEAYGGLILRSGLVPVAQVESWLAEQRHSLEVGTYFAACNYYTYLAKRP